MSAPLSVPTGITTDPEAQKEYTDALNKQLAALENRGGTNWFNIAAAFADPGRTGSFGESFGKAMGVVGKQREEEEARALPVAQMRAQLAGQKYEMGKEAKALDAFANVLGATPQTLQEGIAQAQYNPMIMSKLTQAMPLFYGSPKITEMAKTIFGQHNDINKMLLEERKAGMTEAEMVAKYGNEILPMIKGYGAIPSAGSAPASGTSSATTPKPDGQYDFSSIVDNGRLTSPVGQRDGVAHNGIDLAAPLGSPIKSPVAGEVVFAGNNGNAGNMVTIRGADGNLHSFMHMDKIGVQVGDKIDPASVLGQVGQTGNARGSHVHYEMKGADGKQINPLDSFKPAPAQTFKTVSEVSGAPRIEANRVVAPDGEILAERGANSLADWSKAKENAVTEYNKRKAETVAFERKQIEEAGKERGVTVAAKVKEVGDINTNDILRNQGLYDSVDNILNTDPEVKKWVGIMFKNGAGAQMYQLAKDGLRIGNFGLALDTYNTLVKDAPPKVQEKLRQMDMLFADIFAQKAKEGKSAFGPSISNFDIVTQKEKMATTRDTAKIINNWLTQERASADHKLEIAGAYSDYLAKTEGTKKQPYQFFSSQEYKDLSKKYGTLYKDLALTMYGAPK